jgi:predicted GH43/DUF377 family glycosyl hydrolase
MDDSISFIKIKEPAIKVGAINFKLLCPRVIKFNNRCYRMYFSQEKKIQSNKIYTVIRSAVSKDCINWLVEEGERVGFLEDKSYNRMLSPAVVKINKDLYRMYFEARTLDNKGVIKSVISNDGLLWEEEPGIRMGMLNNFSYGTPFCFYETNNFFELYFERRSKTNRDIWVATSSDGIFFDERKIIQVIKQEKILESYAIYSPDISYSKNCYHMYYSGWGGEPVSGHILYAYSYDKKNWKKQEIPVLSPGGTLDQKHCSEPSLIKIGDKLKIFYE